MLRCISFPTAGYWQACSLFGFGGHMGGKNLLANVVTGIMVVCALAMTGLVARREFANNAAALSITTRDDWRRFEVPGHHMGALTAPVKIVEFADFECPACRQLYFSLDSLNREQPGLIDVSFRHYPIRGHRFALPALRASECADRQGRFAPMHNVLFEQQDSLGLAPWSWFAHEAGVPDARRFTACMSNRDPIAELQRDTLAAHELHVTGTPLVLIGKRQFTGAPGLTILRGIVARAKNDSHSD
jgi:hypothetical protein